MKTKKITLLNIISNILLQIITIFSGFIIPKLILENFGSEVNGLVASLNQFLSYITLLEGGITGVVMTALYKPIVEKNDEKISSIMNTSKSFFRKISIIFVIYTLLLSFVYPLVFKTHFSFEYIMSLTWILSIGLLIQYTYSINLRVLLNADKKVYIVSLVQASIIILNIILSIVVVNNFNSVHLLKITSNLLFILQPIVYSIFVKKYFKLDNNAPQDKNLLKNRWNGFAINLAAFIHFSTDVTILSIFTNLQIVSVYSVYALVTNGLRQFVIAVTNGINPTIGQTYASGNDSELNKKMDLYEYIILLVVFLLFTLAGILITPFVMIYTSKIADANYYQPLFGVLIVLSEALYLIKYPHLHLAYSANKYKEVTPSSYIEAFINIVISIILVNKYGIVGVAIGTTVAMLYKMIFHVYFSTKIVKSRKQKDYYNKLLLFVIATILGIYLCNLVPIELNYNITNWLLCAIIYSIILIAIYIIISLLFFKKEIKQIFDYIKK